MNRSLGAVYTRNENQQIADLLRRIEELKKKKRTAEETAGRTDPRRKDGTAGKSYELACPVGSSRMPRLPCEWPDDRKTGTAVRPVKQVQNQVVSSLAQPMGNERISSPNLWRGIPVSTPL